MRKIMKSGAALLAVALLFAALGGAALAAEDAATVSVNASATLYMQPERAVFSVGVNTREKTVGKAQASANKIIDKVIKALVGTGIAREDISASYLSVYADYNYNVTPATITGYTATHQLDVKTTDISNVGKIIDAALDAGANQLNSVSFGVVDGSDTYRAALKMAVDAAKTKAQVLAEASGKTLGALVRIEEQPTYNMYESYYANASDTMGRGDGQGGTDVLTGNIGVTASVVAVYAVE
jgi:uncharacterized protein YggE